MLPPDTTHTTLPDPPRPANARRHGRRARALGDDTRSLDQQPDRLSNFVERRDERAIDGAADHRPHFRQHATSADAVDEARRALDDDGLHAPRAPR